MQQFTLLALLACFPAALLAAEKAEPSPATLKALEAIGTWDGTTPEAKLEGPYEDPKQAAVPFGRKSYYLAPWRAWMDTWPARRFLRMPGVNFNVREPRAYEPVAKVLADAGIASARVEVGWGSFDFEDPTRLRDADRVRAKLRALERHGIRPLLLLNANSGWPCPIRSWRVRRDEDAPKGTRSIRLEKPDGIVPGATGLHGQAYQTAYPLIVAVDAETGRCDLSAPLPKALEAGPVQLNRLRYRPLSFERFADGRPNPAAKETLEGWLTYVRALTAFAKDALGTREADDAGFDLEVWNELTFGSHFLDSKHYYDPPRKRAKPRFRYKGKDFGYEVLLAMTVDFARDPAHGLPGVRVIDGFSNQRPWEAGSTMWPGQAGISRHYYTGIDPYRPFDANHGCVSPETDDSKSHPVLDALGRPDGKVENGQAVPGTYFVPAFRASLPETWFYGYKTEMMSREVVPWLDTMKGHGRYTHPGTGRHAEIWQTEFNMDRSPWARHLREATGCEKDDPRLRGLMHAVAAKVLLRTYLFYSHKGLETIEIFAAREPDTSLGMIPTHFYEALETADFALTDAVRARRGPQLAALGRAVRVMRRGRAMAEARPLTVDRLVEEKPRLVFRGDGTPAHPDRYHRHDFACLPWQLGPGKFVVAWYVVTRNVVHAWDESRGHLDPERYAMPDQTFRLTLGNMRGQGATVTAYDPLADHDVPVRVIGATPTTLTVSLPTVDYARLLVIEEAKPGPLVQEPRLTPAADGSAMLTFHSPVAGTAEVTWGAHPDRTSGGSKKLSYRKRFRLRIPRLGKGDGVRVELAADHLRAVWPRWPHDTAGVRW